ncbi:MAG: exosome complex exonuclease Rrp41 [Nanoarchaeota archaeon]|nr:exosome complex exonuclease Rrp41 [Nanoarchaeota archaeon]
MPYTKRFDGRKFDETRKIEAEVGVIPNADGSAMFCFGDTKAIAAVYGPRTLYPQHLQDPTRGRLKCIYDMLSFSVTERKRPGPSRRSIEISMVTEKALNPALKLEKFPNSAVNLYIMVIQANAGTRTAGINAASLALAHAGLPMTDLVSSVSVGKIGGKICVDLTKDEEDYKEKDEKDTTDIPFAIMPRNGKVTLLQLDGKITSKELKEALQTAKKVCNQIYEVQKKVLQEALNK